MNGIDRRRFLIFGAVAASGAWITPSVVVLDSANASGLHSQPPRRPPGGPRRPPAGSPPPGTNVNPPTGELAFTGNDERIGAVIGGAIVAAGAVAVGLGESGQPEWDE